MVGEQSMGIWRCEKAMGFASAQPILRAVKL
jgi:hypothetical protein